MSFLARVVRRKLTERANRGSLHVLVLTGAQKIPLGSVKIKTCTLEHDIPGLLFPHIRDLWMRLPRRCSGEGNFGGFAGGGNA